MKISWVGSASVSERYTVVFLGGTRNLNYSLWLFKNNNLYHQYLCCIHANRLLELVQRRSGDHLSARVRERSGASEVWNIGGE